MTGPRVSISCGRESRSAPVADAARQMVEVLMLCREHGPEVVELAVGGGVTSGRI